jgi:8-oxo-dGTP pyrophosphatase MutT (NUDIX family)
MGGRAARDAARLVVVDGNGLVLLVRYVDGRPDRPASYWATPGGALEPGETHRAAAARELREETGLDAQVGSELFERSFNVDYGDGPVHQVERYFLVRLAAVRPFVTNSSSEAIREHRWWSLAELEATREVVFPEQFARSLARIISGDAA